jgi:hypothetical protein
LRGHAWFTFNPGTIGEDSIQRKMDRAVDSESYGGFMITPSPASRGRPRGADAPAQTGVIYLDDEFFRLYRYTIELGLENGLPMDVLYDELRFPPASTGRARASARAYRTGASKSCCSGSTHPGRARFARTGPIEVILSALSPRFDRRADHDSSIRASPVCVRLLCLCIRSFVGRKLS